MTKFKIKVPEKEYEKISIATLDEEGNVIDAMGLEDLQYKPQTIILEIKEKKAKGEK